MSRSGSESIEVPVTLHKSVLETPAATTAVTTSAIATEADGLFPTEEFQRRSG